MVDTISPFILENDFGTPVIGDFSISVPSTPPVPPTPTVWKQNLLTHWWKFNGSPVTNEIRPTETITTTGTPTFVSGPVVKAGSAYSFANKNVFFNTATNSAPAGIPYTMTLWWQKNLKLYSSDNYLPYVVVWGSGEVSLENVNNDDQLAMRYYNTSVMKQTQLLVDPTVLDTWYFLSLVISANNVKGYKNGSLIVDTNVNILGSSVTSHYFGDILNAYGASGACTMDDIRIYSGAMVASDIASIYKAGSGDWP